jgi:hypothetical protein
MRRGLTNQGLINGEFREYIKAEVNVMLNDIGPNVKPGSTRFTIRALKWIEQNAADFRMKWDREKDIVVGEAVADRKESR